MEKREILLRRVMRTCYDFARQLSFHRALQEIGKGSLRISFWIDMNNNAIDLAVLNWMHLFGSHSDDIHWKKLVKDESGFRRDLLNHLRITKEEWEPYRKKIKEYRDKDVAHIEAHERADVSDMSTAFKAVDFYYQYVFQELSEYADYASITIPFIEYYAASLKQATIFVETAYQSTKHLKESLY